MENVLQNKGMFDNEKLFDTAGHLTDEGLYALQEGTLDELGSLEAAEHLTFCDYCLARYAALMEALDLKNKLQDPMRDLIPQVQAMMRLRSFRVISNKYVSAAAAVVLALALWSFGLFGGKPGIGATRQSLPTAQPIQHTSISQMLSGAFDHLSSGVDHVLNSMQVTAQSGLAQLADPGKAIKNSGKAAADGE